MKRKKQSSPRLFLVMYVLLFIAMMGLSLLRFQVAHLEQALKELKTKIESCEAEESALGRDFAALTSPSQIYDHWKTALGMDQVKQEQLQKIRVFQGNAPGAGVANALPFPSPSQGWRSRFFSLLGLSAN